MASFLPNKGIKELEPLRPDLLTMPCRLVRLHPRVLLSIFYLIFLGMVRFFASSQNISSYILFFLHSLSMPYLIF